MQQVKGKYFGQNIILTIKNLIMSEKRKESLKQFEQVFVSIISALAPMMLIITMLCTFVVIAIFSTKYYQVSIFKLIFVNSYFSFSVALFCSIILQLSRLSFGLASVDEFAEGKMGRGLLGLLFSLALTVYEISQVVFICDYYEKLLSISANSLQNLLICIVILGFALELRLVINVRKVKSTNPLLNSLPPKKHGAVANGNLESSFITKSALK